MTCEHGNILAVCGQCASVAKAAGGLELGTWNIARAKYECDQVFPKRFVTATPTDPAVIAWAVGYISNPTEARSLLLLGPTGVGKTYQAYGALRSAVSTARAPKWAATTFADFIADLRPSGKDPEGTLNGYRSAGLLLLDDLGAAKSSEWVEETTYRLLNYRYEAMLPSIFTTNLPLAQLREGLGDRLASRLVETCDRVVLAGADRRRAAA